MSSQFKQFFKNISIIIDVVQLANSLLFDVFAIHTTVSLVALIISKWTRKEWKYAALSVGRSEAGYNCLLLIIVASYFMCRRLVNLSESFPLYLKRNIEIID